MKISTAVVAFAATLALGVVSASAFPAAPVQSGDQAVIQVAKKHRGEISREEGATSHKKECWVSRDSIRNFGYWKC
jgi:hypothetical protein